LPRTSTPTLFPYTTLFRSLASDCDGSNASSVAHLRSVLASAVASADHSAGMTDSGSGHANTTNSGPTWAASQANLRDDAVRLRRSEEHTSELQSPCNLVCR